jgi:hypothetical protein
MSSTIRVLFFAIALAAPAGVLAQGLVCPPATSAMTGPCERFHFHQQMYWPETHTFIDNYGVTQFASESACDRAREAEMKRNQAVADFIRKARNDTRYEIDRFGPCHCDLTFEKSSPLFLDDAQRQAQVKLVEEVRMRVRWADIRQRARPRSRDRTNLSAPACHSEALSPSQGRRSRSGDERSDRRQTHSGG